MIRDCERCGVTHDHADHLACRQDEAREIAGADPDPATRGYAALMARLWGKEIEQHAVDEQAKLDAGIIPLPTGRFEARVHYGGKTVYAGRHDTPEEAREAQQAKVLRFETDGRVRDRRRRAA